MRDFITILFLFFSVFGFSQDSEIYKLVFENKDNFKFLDFYDTKTREKMISYKVLDITYAIHPMTFKYAHNIYYSKNLADSLMVYSKAHSKEATIDYANKISYLLTPLEQDYLYKEALQSRITKVDIKSPKVIMMSDTSFDNVLYFQVSNIIYSDNKKKAYLRVSVCYNNDLLGYSIFVYGLINDKWVQVYDYERIIL